MNRPKVLLFTDSRGEHRPKGSQHKIFSERLADCSAIEVTRRVCPYKWTTILDFINEYQTYGYAKFDLIVLYAGIVDWSPRPLQSAINQVYENTVLENTDRLFGDTSLYARKVVNYKKPIFDKVFGSETMRRHFQRPYSTYYEGSPTISLYSAEMAKEFLIPRLHDIPNLVFVNSNRFAKGWEGDYPRVRPKNISVTHEYADAFATALGQERCIDLRDWTDEEVKENTCDNIHLSAKGSEQLFILVSERLSSRLGLDINPPRESATAARLTLNRQNSTALLDRLRRATLVIGFRATADESERLRNLNFLISTLIERFGGAVDILVVEHSAESLFRELLPAAAQHVRYCYIKSSSDYNRGVAYNYAVRYFCDSADVVGFLDTDVLVGDNFVDCIDLARSWYVAVSPYRNIQYASDEQSKTLVGGGDYPEQVNSEALRNPVTISGGILIIRKSAFLAVGGFQQYQGYGCEDRALDVELVNRFGNESVYVAEDVYLHLFHPSDKGARRNFAKIYDHLTRNYRCQYDPSLGPLDYIHENCRHVGEAQTSLLSDCRAASFGVDVETEGRSHFSVNGVALSSGLVEEIGMLNRPVIPVVNRAIREGRLSDALNICEIAIEKAGGDPDLRRLYLAKAEEVQRTYERERGASCPARKEVLVVLGNGPSLRHVDFSVLKDVDTFGLNSAYRFYQELDFYPTYFGCFDNLVTSNHREGFQQLLSDPLVPIRRFFFIQDFDDPYGRLFRVPFSAAELRKAKARAGVSTSLKDYWIYENSGASAMHAGIAMGYRKIILLGVDCSYVQVVEGAETHNGKANELVITRTPAKNPNYWRDDYQVAGDVYHVPDAGKFQKPEWERLAKNIYSDPAVAGIEISNCSPTTTLDCFPKRQLWQVLPRNDARLTARCTALIKAFGRFDLLKGLVQSIRARSSELRIDCLDDSGRLSESMIDELRGFGVRFIESPEFDIGLSAGRNLLLANCETPYFILLDEDFLFTEKTDFLSALHLLNCSSIDLIGGAVFDVGPDAQPHNQPRSFVGDLEKTADGVLRIHPSSEARRSVEGLPLCDLVMNFFVAKSASVRRVGWSEELKLGEHLDFFMRAQQAGLNIHYSSGMQVDHVQHFGNASSGYGEARSRASEYLKAFRSMHGLVKIVKYGVEIPG